MDWKFDKALFLAVKQGDQKAFEFNTNRGTSARYFCNEYLPI